MSVICSLNPEVLAVRNLSGDVTFLCLCPKLKTLVLIHTATNDEDVNVLEVQRLMSALKAEGKQFESKVYENPPGGHHFNRIDTKLARDSRAEIYEFLKKYLKP